MDQYRQKAARSGSWARKERKAMKGEVRARLKAEDRQEATCETQKVSSRMCSRGTKSCITDHGEE